MNAELITAYRKERAARPYLSASQCLKMAQYNLRMHAARRFIPGGPGDVRVMPLPRAGEYLNITLEHDDDADIGERLQVETESAGDDSDLRHYARSGWIARDGRVLFDANGRHRSGFDWQWWSDNYGFAQMWEDGKRGHSRHDAWLRARELVAQAFKFYTEAREDGYVGYVVTLHDAEGEELDRDSCWGFEASGNYAGQEAFAAAEGMAETRAEYWLECDKRHAEHVAQSRRDMRLHRALFGKMASEYRALRSHPDARSFALSLDALRGSLCHTRAVHREALRVVIA